MCPRQIQGLLGSAGHKDAAQVELTATHAASFTMIALDRIAAPLCI